MSKVKRQINRILARRVLLTMFYHDYANWLRAGAPEGIKHIFMRHVGLCSNLELWGRRKSLFFFGGVSKQNSLAQELQSSFSSAGLNKSYPFYKPDMATLMYTTECRNETCHLNEQRRKWVFDRERKVPFIKKVLAYFYFL